MRCRDAWSLSDRPVNVSHQRSRLRLGPRSQKHGINYSERAVLDNGYVHDVAALEAVLAGLALDDPARFGVLANLGTALSMRGQRDASPEDLDQALEVFKQALAAAHDAAERALVHANGSRALRLRHEFLGADADLDVAIEEIERALTLTPADSSAWVGRSTALSLALLARFEERGLRDDLEKAVAAARAAANREDSAPLSRARCTSNLSIVLKARYEWLGEPADLDESVIAQPRQPCPMQIGRTFCPHSASPCGSATAASRPPIASRTFGML